MQFTGSCPVQVWTYASRVAFVLSVTAKGQPIHEDIRLQRLQQLLLLRMSPDGNATVNTHKVRWTHCTKGCKHVLKSQAVRCTSGVTVSS